MPHDDERGAGVGGRLTSIAGHEASGLPAVLACPAASGFVQQGAAAAATERAHTGQAGAKEQHGDGLGDD
jgi:hypothetical protein